MQHLESRRAAPLFAVALAAVLTLDFFAQTASAVTAGKRQ
jgi:hypothetical protein